MKLRRTILTPYDEGELRKYRADNAERRAAELERRVAALETEVRKLGESVTTHLFWDDAS